MGIGALKPWRTRRAASGGPAKRAVIDIGSNSLRLVVWAGPLRDPHVLLNEKVSANLGRTLSKDGLLPRKAIDLALRGLARFALLARLLEVEGLRVVATAAVRDAGNGAEFLDRVRALGLSPELLSGEQEAEASAMGVLSAFPHANGIVGDLGGGSLELVRVGEGAVGRGDSFPWGTLRLAALRQKGAAAFEREIKGRLDDKGWRNGAEGGNLYLVGGSWRALTLLAMHDAGFPLFDPHGYEMPPERATALTVALIEGGARRLQEVPRLPNARVASLPDAAALLDVVVRHVRPKALVTSAFGLREGLLFEAMDAATRAEDPLIVSIREQAAHGLNSPGDGDALERWIAPLCAAEPPAHARLRLAACLLATMVEAAGREARAQRSVELALHERWIGLAAPERAMIAAALLTEAGEKALPHQLGLLCDADRLARGARWGQAMRFARKLGGGVADVLTHSAVRIDAGKLVLSLDRPLAALYGEAAEQQHRTLAAQYDLAAVLEVRDPG